MSRTNSLDEVVIADDPSVWAGLGFRVEDDLCQVGSVNFRLTGRSDGGGIERVTLRDLKSEELDGLAIELSGAPERSASEPHPNGVGSLDHIVAFSWDLDRTVDALVSAGLNLRLIREEPTPAGAPRQAFFRLGSEVLEVVQSPEGPARPTRFWGLAFNAVDLAAIASNLGELGSGLRPAVQPGREIVTLRRAAGAALPIAFMSAPKGI